tara:strand:+ start:2455 stop:3321 length:867 start_codon:yes stop_codon:yes gene_type:complete
MPASLHQILAKDGTVVFPGVYDTLSALVAEQAGFPLAFMSGYAVSATLIGAPDLGLLTQTEVIGRARQITRVVSIPLIVDADTGYGNALNVARTVNELIEAGAAGCFLEDQVWPKRCGHMRGKGVVPRDEYLQKIKAAVDTRGSRDFFIVARTDALGSAGMDEALTRVKAARETGADATFIEAPGSIEELAIIGRHAPKPTVANMVEQGKTPLLGREELAALGFAFILYPVAGLYASAHALATTYAHLQKTGTTNGVTEQLVTFQQFNEMIGIPESYEPMTRKSNGDT